MQAPFQGAGVAESTVMLQVAGKGYGTHIIDKSGGRRGKDDRKLNTLAQLAEPTQSTSGWSPYL